MVKPHYIEVQDTGNENLPTMDIDITINCDSKELTVEVSSEEDAVENAWIYLFYTDYGYQALPNSGQTDANGRYTMEVAGSMEFLTAMFILRVDNPAYQSREIEFAYEKCFEEPPECLVHADCQVGYVCENEECVECIVDNDCSAGYVCENEECVEEPECIANNDCPTGYTCEHEECVEEPECVTNSDCAQGYGCENEECVEIIAPPPHGPPNVTENETTAPPIEETPICPIAFVLFLLLVIKVER